MKQLKQGIFLITALIFSLSILLVPAHPETLQEKSGERPQNSITIKSNTMEVDEKLKMVTFTGDVNAREDNLEIDCLKMSVFYESLPDEKGAGTTSARIEKIVATGNVRINRLSGGTATAEKAVFYKNNETVVLTGKPVVKQGDDFVEGEQITIFLKENRSVVEGSQDKKVRATIFPKRESENSEER